MNSDHPPLLPATFYSNYLSNLAKERVPSPIRSLYPLEARPGLISLLAGKPNASTFPFTSIKLTARSPIDPSKEAEAQVTIDGKLLDEALQYGPTAGLPALCKWFAGLQKVSHGRGDGEGWRISVGTGSQDLIYKAIMCIVNDGEPVLVESPCYAGTIPIFTSLHCEQIEVDTDAHGICSSHLRTTLENWPSNKPKPKILYTVPYGCNPSGMTATVERRKEVLALAREHGFIIFEDDPYYYLYYGDTPRPPSYFALEKDEPEMGRVLRFDSLSKILSAGIRVGFVSGPEPLLHAIDSHTTNSNLQSSSLAQAITVSLLEEWGYDAFWRHTRNVSDFYRSKRDVFESAMRRHLSGLAEWTPPQSGMFFWFKLLLRSGPEGEKEADSSAVIRTNAYERGVLALPGTVFLPNGGKTAYVRAAFSLIEAGDVDEAVKRLRDTILEVRASEGSS